MFTEKNLHVLEFDKIREMLVALCPTKGAKKRATELVPSEDIDEVTHRLRATSDAKRMYDEKGLPPFGNGEDLTALCDSACKGAMLSARDLLAVSSAFRSVRQMGDYFRENRRFDTVLDEVFRRLLPNRHLEESIDRSVLSEDMIADEASTSLADIRRQMRAQNQKIKDTLQRYISGSYSQYLQDNLVTMRDGRYVIPVKAECRNQVKGLVHDTSASGSTVFIEPMSVVDANNELKLLSQKEEKEIQKILYQLSSLVASSSESLRLNYENTTELAFAFGCALLSLNMDAVEPTITKERRLDLLRARHPLIDREKVVPTTLSLGKERDTLVITGPNTGGKTVTLKTVGLFAVMAQAGLHVPAREATLPVFDGVYADIGDEQSIAQNLSTFSSHMVNIVSITETVTEKSLCLFDELGAGTDPTEGASLAEAIIEFVRSRHALCMATTHYTELKTYALEREGVENASCEFDVSTLQPTYRLLIGTPGKSNAFAIAGRLGLDEGILQNAKRNITADHVRFETVIEKLEASRLQADRDREEASEWKAKCLAMYQNAEQEIQRKNAETLRQIEENKQKANRMLDSARATADFVLAELEKARKAEAEKKLTETLDNSRIAVKKSLNEGDNIVNPVEVRKNQEGYKLPRALKIGDRVFLVNIGAEAEVLTLPDKSGKLQVATGSMVTRTSVENLQLLTPPKKEKEKKRENYGMTKTSNADFHVELDLRGCLGEEAWDKTDKYLDDAVLSGIPTVRIVHGKGTGALRRVIQERLKHDKRVKSYRLGQYGEGDSGVTVVELK